MTHSPHDSPIDLQRREFLLRCCQGTAATFIPTGLRRFGLPGALFDAPVERSPSGEFHLHPHYRMPLPLDPLLLKTQAGLDEFVTEKYADEIAAILTKWSEQWCASPFDLARNTAAVANFLLADFAGATLQPTESRTLRKTPVEIRRNTFSSTLSLGCDAFLADLRSGLSAFTRIQTAELQITQISAQKALEIEVPERLHTRIRYELVGQGTDLHFEQRVGEWEITWESTSAGQFLIRNWRAVDETQSVCPSLAFLDITPIALRKSGTPDQLQHGSDYWRTALDAACGIDIYGHNGVSVGDIDDDGFDDFYVCQPGGLPNRLFRNRGDGTFEDITESSGVGVIENTACALFVDVDNDGCQDLIVVRANGPLLFLNDGNGKFHQKPHAFHFAQPPQGTFVGAAVADYDRDGWLDIYFALYIYYQGASQYKYPSPYFDANNGPPNFMMRNNRDGTFRDVTAETGLNVNNTRYSFCCGWSDFNRDGWPDLYVINDFGRKNLYRNNGDGTFTDIAAEAGVEDVGAGMGVCWFDYDNDGYDDLYVANMWTAAGERITMQDEFRRNSPPEIRMLYHKHAMGNSLFKNGIKDVIKNKSKNDVILSEAGTSHSEVPAKSKDPYLTRKSSGNNRTFSDTTDSAGVRIARWAWSCDAWDFDHDGFSDLYCVNGMVTTGSRDDLNSFFWRQVVAKSPDQPRPSHDYEQGWGAINELIRADHTWSGYERNIFYANNGDGTFSDISGVLGLDFIEDGRSFALSDFDLDGRQELFLKNRTAPQLRILHNVLADLPPSISFRLHGTKSNRDAIGAVVTVTVETQLAASPASPALPNKLTQTRSLQAGSGFISQHSKDIFFGLGESDGHAPPSQRLVHATIRWPSGRVQEFRDLPANHRIWIEEGLAQAIKLDPFRPTPKEGWFDSSVLPNVSHDLFLSTPGLSTSGLSAPRFETWLLAPVAAPDFSLPPLSVGDVETWPSASPSAVKLSALRGKPVLLHFASSADDGSKEDWSAFHQYLGDWPAKGFQVVSIDFADAENRSIPQHRFAILQGTDDVAAIYNILFRYLFDRHRDIDLPTSFLINAEGEIVKVYQGPVDPAHVEHDFRNIPGTAADRMARALPYPGVAEITEFSRNYLSFGSVYFQRGYLDQALAAFQVASRDDPESAEAVYGIGSIYLEQKKNAEAQACFERALKLQASYPDTLANSWNNLGLIAARDGAFPEAIADFLQALRLSPDHLIAMNNLGGAYRQSRSWQDAQAIYERALTLKPTDADANYGIGMVYAQKGDTTKTEEYLKRALALKPAYPEALNNLGILYLRTQRRNEAVASFQESIRVAPDFDQAYLNLARVHAIEGNNEKARAVLQELLKRHPDNPAARDLLSQLNK